MKIAIINASTVISDIDALSCVRALQIQLDRDYLPLWGKRADLFFYSKTDSQKIDLSEFLQLIIMDTTDQAQAEGFHDLTASGLPIGKIFAKTTMDAGDSWTVTASHELLEIMADPYINLTANSSDGTKQFAYENCDAVEETDYDINGIRVSNFVTPAWFEDGIHIGQTQYDYLKLLTKPFQLLAGGYIGVRDLTKANGWTQLTARHLNIPGAVTHYKNFPHTGSRRERRQRGKLNWMTSELKKS